MRILKLTEDTRKRYSAESLKKEARIITVSLKAV